MHNAGNEIDDALTRGYANEATAGVGNLLRSLGLKNSTPDIATLRAQTAQGREDLGPVAANAIDIATSMAGPTMKLPAAAADKVIEKTGSKLLGWGAGALTAGGTSAVDAAAGTYGHGGSTDDALSAAKWGGGVGTLLGMLGVGSNKALTGAPGAPAYPSPPSASPSIVEKLAGPAWTGPFKDTAALQAESDAARAAMKPITFDPSDSDRVYDAARSSLTPAQRSGISPGMNQAIKAQRDEIANAANGPSADDINGFAGRIFDGATSRDDQALAAKIKNNLTNGVLGGAQPTSGHAVGEAIPLNDAANQATSNLKNSQMLDDWRAAAKIPGSGGIGEEATTGAQSALKNQPYYYSDPSSNAAMKNIAGAGSLLPGSWLFKHSVGYPLAGAAVGGLLGGGHGYQTGGDSPWVNAGKEALEMGSVGLLTGYGLPLARSGLASRALNQSAPALTQGATFAKQPPATGALLRALLNSQGSAGAGY